MARTLITSAIPYINGIKHLGNLVGSQLPADLHARFLRLSGHEVMFICATDEHGTPAELAALEAGEPVAQYCARMHKVQRELAKGFRLSFDYFGRSSSARNRDLTQHFAGRLADNGHLYEVTEQQIYSRHEQRFLPDRYVTGECPNCGYERARGDQCENCTKQLDPSDLINPRSQISGSSDLEMRRTKHLYLRQSKFIDRLDSWIDSQSDWPTLTVSIAKKWLHDGGGLQDRGITRDLVWGVPVQRGRQSWPGMEDKVFYVWFDAPIEYIAATAEWADANDRPDADWLRWWKTDEGAKDVRYVQFMGKDNVPFHTLSFPVTIMGSGEQWKLVDFIKSFNFLNYEGGQFSTSQKRGIFMDQALDTLPSDYWRWWLLSHAPEYSDSEFTWSSFVDGVNSDLANVLGNFISRVCRFCVRRFGSRVPEQGNWTDIEHDFTNRIQAHINDLASLMYAMEVRKSAQQLRKTWALGNEYIQLTAPWAAIRSDQERAATIISYALNLASIFSTISSPFIPDASARLRRSLHLENTPSWPTSIPDALRQLQPGAELSDPGVLFAKLTEKQCDQWKREFAGTR